MDNGNYMNNEDNTRDLNDFDIGEPTEGNEYDFDDSGVDTTYESDFESVTSSNYQFREFGNRTYLPFTSLK
jgi:hypothetical protein